MSYTPTTWATGDTVTSTKLNNMETGIQNAQVLLVTLTTQDMQNFTSDKTFNEISTAFSQGKMIFLTMLNGIVIMPICGCTNFNGAIFQEMEVTDIDETPVLTYLQFVISSNDSVTIKRGSYLLTASSEL